MAADDSLRQFEALLGAISNITEGKESEGLVDARCPQCNASDFAKVADLYDAAMMRFHINEGVDEVPRDAGLTDGEVLKRFAPPKPTRVAPRVVLVALIFGGAAGYAYKRFGESVGMIAILVAIVAVVFTLLTRMRAASDDYYNGRARWRKLYICRQCRQVVKA